MIIYFVVYSTFKYHRLYFWKQVKIYKPQFRHELTILKYFFDLKSKFLNTFETHKSSNIMIFFKCWFLNTTRDLPYLQLLLLSKSATQSTPELVSKCQETKMKQKRNSQVLLVPNKFCIPTGAPGALLQTPF